MASPRRSPTRTRAPALLTRAQLYDLIWLATLRDLEPVLGVSNATISRVCAEALIPMPSSGHRRTFGMGLEKRPSIPHPETAAATVRLKVTDLARQLLARKAPILSLTVADDVHDRSAAGNDREAATDDALPTGNSIRALSELHPRVEAEAVDTIASRVHYARRFAEAHPLVARTARFFDTVERAFEEYRLEQVKVAAANAAGISRRRLPHRASFRGPRTIRGRFTPDVGGCLRVSVMREWAFGALQLFDYLLAELESAGCEIKGGAIRDLPRGLEATRVSRNGATVSLSFVQQTTPRADLPRASHPADHDGYVGSNLFRLYLHPDAKQPSREHVLTNWPGPMAKLIDRVPAIAARIVQFLVDEPARLAEIERQAAREAFERDRLEEERKADSARAAVELACTQGRQRAWLEEQRAKFSQVTRARDVARACREHRGILQMLAEVETHASHAADDEARILRAWIAVVHAQLLDPVKELVGELLAEEAAQVGPAWMTRPVSS